MHSFKSLIFEEQNIVKAKRMPNNITLGNYYIQIKQINECSKEEIAEMLTLTHETGDMKRALLAERRDRIVCLVKDSTSNELLGWALQVTVYSNFCYFFVRERDRNKKVGTILFKMMKKALDFDALSYVPDPWNYRFFTAVDKKHKDKIAKIVKRYR